MTKPNSHVAADRLTFAGLLQLIEFDAELAVRRKRDFTSSLKSFARLLEIDMERSVAGIAPYRDRLDRFDPVVAGVSPKRWANIRSDTMAVFRRYGIRQGSRPAPSDLTNDWRRLRKAAHQTDIRFVRGLSRFIHYCSVEGVAPDEVDDAVMQTFATFLADRTLHRKPRRVHQRTCVLWNRAVRQIDCWPKRIVTIPRYRDTFSLPLTQFPEAFRSDLEGWLDRLRGKDLLATDAPLRPLRPDTIIGKRDQMRRLASALVRSGRPATEVTSLGCLIELENFRRALNWLLNNRADGEPTPSLFELAYSMLSIAKYWARVPEPHLAELRRIVDRLRCRNRGLTTKNREILRQFDDPMNVFKLLTLPELLVAHAKRQRNVKKATLSVQLALAIEIELHAPIRLKNLINLRLDRHFDHSRADRKGVVHLVIPEAEVKNSEPLEFVLPKSIVKLLEVYRKTHLPRLTDGELIWLFPGQNGGAKHKVTLTGQIVTAIRRHTGLRMTVHAFRHVAAKIYLDRNPGAYALVSRLLGHRSIQTTMCAYTGLESKAAGIAYDQEILRLRDPRSRPARRPK
jgi:integrase